MIFSFVFQLLLNGIIAGSLYSLVACSFSLIYTTNKFVNFVFGGVLVLSGYVQYVFFKTLNMPFLFGVFLTIVIMLLFGVLTMKFIFNKLRNRNSSNAVLLIASLGLLTLIENFLLLFFGAKVKTYSIFVFSDFFSNVIIIFNSVAITYLELFIVLFSLLILLFIFIFLKKTKTGLIMQAVCDNPNLSETIGISVLKIRYLAVIIASLIAAFAGILMALEYDLAPSMGTGFMIKGFCGAVIGGMASVVGSVYGAFIVGILENICLIALPSAYKNAISFSLLFLFLLFRPQGLFNLKEEKSND